jgi:molybdate transport system substrate-binding protein
MEEIARLFQTETGIAVLIVPGPSSALARQIAQGSPADIFLPADQASGDYVEKQGLVQQRRNLLGNRLVVVTPAEQPVAVRSLADLADARIKLLSLADPAVPAGKYARQALQNANAWEKVSSKVVNSVDVRATMQFVARGEAEAGIVYSTDAAATSRVRIAYEVPATLHDKIEYPVLLLTARKSDGGRAEQFYQFLFSEKAAAVFRRFHFTVLSTPK